MRKFGGDRLHLALSFALTLWMVLVPAIAKGEIAPRLLAALPSTGRWDYEVIRAAERIGAHSVIFQRDGRRLSIVTLTSISVEFLGITLFRYRYDAEEEWIDGQLMRLISRTDDDGDRLEVDLAVTDGRLRGTCNGTALDLPASILTVSTWHPDILQSSVLLDQYKCVERQVQIANHGIEPILAEGQMVRAQHYAITGQLTRDVWYGPEGQTVQVRFPAKDDSEITFVLLKSSESQ